MATRKRPLKVRILWTLCAALVLVIGYLICGHALLFLHLMGQWPIVLLIFGLLMIGIAALTDSRRAMFGVAFGYVIGFALGMLFDFETFDPDSMTMRNHMWQIWTVSYLAFIFAGFIWDGVAKLRARSQPV